jgi:hypothetical protein
LARHCYDLWRLVRADVGDKALADKGLFHHVAAHRAIFFPQRKAQESLRPGALRLLPREENRPLWKRDYEAMRDAMIFGETPDFNDILSVVAGFEHRFNGMA